MSGNGMLWRGAVREEAGRSGGDTDRVYGGKRTSPRPNMAAVDSLWSELTDTVPRSRRQGRTEAGEDPEIYLSNPKIRWTV